MTTNPDLPALRKKNEDNQPLFPALTPGVEFRPDADRAPDSDSFNPDMSEEELWMRRDWYLR